MEPTMKYNTSNNGWRNSNLVQAWLVLLLALCFGTALAAVQINLSGIIADNKLNETLSKVPELVLGSDNTDAPETAKATPTIDPGTFTVQKTGKSVTYPIYRMSRDGRLEGWVIKSGGQGYADKIELLLGLDPSGATITGLFVLEQKETPGLGNKIIDTDWRGQFIHKKTDRPLTVQKGGSQGRYAIDAITGATISSRAVTGIVNGIVSDVRGRLTPENIRFAEGKTD